jgi:hypothetical protein
MTRRTFSLMAAALFSCGGADDSDGSGIPDGSTPIDGSTLLDSSTPPDGSDDRPDASGRLCAERSGGALITFGIGDERLIVWSTEEAFIGEARAIADGASSRIPHFQRLLDGTDCDPQWTWHVAPDEMEWVDVMMELCDGLPSMVEDDKTYWLEDVGTFCPWIVNVVDVVAR